MGLCPIPLPLGELPSVASVAALVGRGRREDDKLLKLKTTRRRIVLYEKERACIPVASAPRWGGRIDDGSRVARYIRQAESRNRSNRLRSGIAPHDGMNLQD